MSYIETVTSKTGRIWTASNLEIDGKKHFKWQEAMENAPTGFRLPTAEEWQEEIETWNSRDIKGALESPLKLTAEGYRITKGYRFDRPGPLVHVGSYGSYWSNSVSGRFARFLYFYYGGAYLSSLYRAFGFSVRYIKE